MQPVEIKPRYILVILAVLLHPGDGAVLILYIPAIRRTRWWRRCMNLESGCEWSNSASRASFRNSTKTLRTLGTRT